MRQDYKHIQFLDFRRTPFIGPGHHFDVSEMTARLLQSIAWKNRNIFRHLRSVFHYCTQSVDPDIWEHFAVRPDLVHFELTPHPSGPIKGLQLAAALLGAEESCVSMINCSSNNVGNQEQAPMCISQDWKKLTTVTDTENQTHAWQRLSFERARMAAPQAKGIQGIWPLTAPDCFFDSDQSNEEPWEAYPAERNGGCLLLLGNESFCREMEVRPLASLVDYHTKIYSNNAICMETSVQCLFEALDSNELGIQDINFFEIFEPYAGFIPHFLETINLQKTSIQSSFLSKVNGLGGSLASGFVPPATPISLIGNLINQLNNSNLKQKGVVMMIHPGDSCQILIIETHP